MSCPDGYKQKRSLQVKKQTMIVYKYLLLAPLVIHSLHVDHGKFGSALEKLNIYHIKYHFCEVISLAL